MGRGIAVASIVLLGVIGCSAEAESGAPGATPDQTVSATPSQAVRIPRQDIPVTVDPKRIVAGSNKSVSITAACPLPQGGPEYRGTARSDAFTDLVTLVPAARGTPEPGTSSPGGLQGNAAIRADAKPGGYRVQVRCEATNDIGDAEFRVVAPASKQPKRTPTGYPTKAPRAGGGGTAAGGPEDGSALPVGMTIAALLAALGVGVGVVRRRTARHGRNGA